MDFRYDWSQYVVAEPDISPILTPPPNIHWASDRIPVAAPPNETPNQFSPLNPFPKKGMLQGCVFLAKWIVVRHN